jgi:NADPH-dependent 2,4-dienoyl-CoA reductase/sulfur reductase-like enzyme
MGMSGIEQFTANINLPENAILAVGAIIDKPVAIDGAKAGKFMRTLKSFIETPAPGIIHKAKITVIGGGVGGYPAAIKASRMGAEVTLIEKDLLGGVCLN